MKKFIALAMVLSVIGSIVAGCGDKETTTTTETSTAGGTTTEKTTTKTDD